MTTDRGDNETAQSLEPTFRFPLFNYTNIISINICNHVTGPVLYTWDTIETKTYMALVLMVPTFKNKILDNHDCPVAIGFLLLLLLISQNCLIPTTASSGRRHQNTLGKEHCFAHMRTDRRKGGTALVSTWSFLYVPNKYSTFYSNGAGVIV